MQRLLIVLSLACASPLVAQNLSGFSRFLVPVYAPAQVSGVGGSSFRTETSAYSPAPCAYWPADHRVAPDRFSTLRGGFSLDEYSIDGSQARFLFVDKSCYDGVKVGLSVTSFGGGPSQPRNSVPVVRERDFLEGEAWLMTVPNVITGDFCLSDNRKRVYRHKLRVFNSDYNDQGVVSVKVWISALPGFGGSPDQEYPVVMNKRDGGDTSFPYYGEVNFENVCLHTTCIGCVASNAIVQVVPASPNLRYWVFVSSIDNSTQQIVVTLPQ